MQTWNGGFAVAIVNKDDTVWMRCGHDHRSIEDAIRCPDVPAHATSQRVEIRRNDYNCSALATAAEWDELERINGC